MDIRMTTIIFRVRNNRIYYEQTG